MIKCSPAATTMGLSLTASQVFTSTPSLNIPPTIANSIYSSDCSELFVQVIVNIILNIIVSKEFF